MGLLDKIKKEAEATTSDSSAADNTKKIAELQKKYDEMIAESYKLSHTDRKASDAKRYDAELIWKEIEKLKA